MSLNMAGHIDGVFFSVPAILNSEIGGQYVDGIWVQGELKFTPYIANLQPLNDKELDFLFRGGERIKDARKLYINSGDLNQLILGDYFSILRQQWKIIKKDVRPWRNYAKIIIDLHGDEVPERLQIEEIWLAKTVDQLYKLINEDFSERLK